MKRVLDAVLSLAALVLLSPVLFAAALACALGDGFPVLFRQQRVGLHGREFRMYKFRSMVRDASAVGPHCTGGSEDPRITRVGRWLRRSSIDELPQLLNVLRGEMSLVGPRPDLPVQRALYAEAEWTERCSVRPGITGLAQVLFRSEATHAQRLAADLRYAREASLGLDLWIMVRTLGRLGGRAAN
ncbi:sugar transferase [Verminephrobacter aporrectodeae subsp. tuberculatae]|uniref:sugar transferase n=1 Tax=Verminephrobacter aporrectodeae TaxID=1110389 RepID=UPI0022390074|nr:sugar transferase [Verminephrobacter aporrectodeae]MCW5257172.1 sugar transferase [Verminephrobacter aporrectodeae subsp. tuberculatae]